jgi:hypothetical protein
VCCNARFRCPNRCRLAAVVPSRTTPLTLTSARHHEPGEKVKPRSGTCQKFLREMAAGALNYSRQLGPSNRLFRLKVDGRFDWRNAIRVLLQRGHFCRARLILPYHQHRTTTRPRRLYTLSGLLTYATCTISLYLSRVISQCLRATSLLSSSCPGGIPPYLHTTPWETRDPTAAPETVHARAASARQAAPLLASNHTASCYDARAPNWAVQSWTKQKDSHL